MKTILAIWHSSNKGKSATLRNVAALLLARSGVTVLFPIGGPPDMTGDFRLVIQINGKVISIESQGDPNTNLKHRLSELVTLYRSDLIFCTTRTRGDTVDAVNSVADGHGYEIIWTSTYQMANRSNDASANDAKARHLLDLLQTLRRI